MSGIPIEPVPISTTATRAEQATRREEFGRAVLATAEPSDRGLVITRVVDAPCDLVFTMWTEPKHVMRWWEPNDVTTLFWTIDLHPGGVVHSGMPSLEDHAS